MKNKLAIVANIKQRSEGIDGQPIPDDEFLFDAEISNSGLDRHFSRMSNDTLENFAKTGNAGVPFLNSHGRGDLSVQIGRVICAEKVDDRVLATISMLRDSEDTPESMRVNEYIRRVERGYLDGVSVGYEGGDEICDICNKDVWDWNRSDPCTHMPGQTYDGVKATYHINGADLREVSLVTAPSNPNAKVLDTREWNEELIAIKGLNKEDDLSPLEKDGLLFRNNLITEALKQGVRAIDGFDEETWKERMAKMEIEHIKEQTQQWTETGDLRWGNGGRKTEDNPVNNKHHANNLILPSYLFQF